MDTGQMNGNMKPQPSCPCVECGKMTECLCDWCPANRRLPPEIWRPGLPPGLKTPLCEYCDSVWMACRFCREERGDMRDWSTKGKPKGSQIGKGMQSHGDGKPSDGNGESGKGEVRGGGKGEVRGGGKSSHVW